MQITLIAIAAVSIISLTVVSVLFYYSRRQSIKIYKELKALKQNPDRSLSVLADLMNEGKTVLEVRRIDSSEIFLRSPRGL